MNKPAVWNNTLYIAILTIILLFVLYSLLFFVYNPNLIKENETLAEKLKYGPLQSLLNGSGINNIPTLNLITTNTAISTANQCGKGPVNIGSSGTDADCIKVCANSSAKAVLVQPGDEYFYGSSAMTEGANCIIGPRPECDTKSSVILMTVNSVICRSKFPRIVGGAINTTVVACNNRLIQDPKNMLWDYKYNEKFNPLTSTILDEDELLPDGTFRFRCKFNGTDSRGNRYQEHPFDRLHPISNYCASLVYRAHPDVRTVFLDAGRDYRCDCGNYDETRTQHLVQGDARSQCSPYTSETTTDARGVQTITIPYKCFTLFSTIDSVASMFPCPNEQFTREGLQMAKVKVNYTLNENILLEHPLYMDMSTDGSRVPSDGAPY